MTGPRLDGARVVLGLDFGGTKIAAAVADTEGERLGTATVSSSRDLGAVEAFERGVQAGRALLEQTVPDAELVILEHSAHMGFVEENEAYVGAVRDFLDRRTAG